MTRAYQRWIQHAIYDEQDNERVYDVLISARPPC